MCWMTALFHYLANRDAKKFVRIGHPISVTLILLAIAFFFTVQMFYVGPQLLSEVGLYEMSWIVAIFIMHNILGNMWACHCTESSVASLPEDRRVPASEEKHLWHFCEACQAMMPPRSWHCKLCNVCILKRDHHCAITATCIGHNNHRYFFWLIFYLLLGSFACLVNTLLFLAMNCQLWTYIPPWVIRLELGASCKHSDGNINGLFFGSLILILNILASIASHFFLVFQILYIYANITFFTPNDTTYDMGFRQNFLLVLGRRGFWTMLSPAIKSPLPHDGTQWQIKQWQNEVEQTV